MPEIISIKRSAGIAGQVQYTATVRYEGEDESRVAFAGSQFGGPVVMLSGANLQVQTFVTNPGRFGKFSEAWVRSFLGES